MAVQAAEYHTISLFELSIGESGFMLLHAQEPGDTLNQGLFLRYQYLYCGYSMLTESFIPPSMGTHMFVQEYHLFSAYFLPHSMTCLSDGDGWPNPILAGKRIESLTFRSAE